MKLAVKGRVRALLKSLARESGFGLLEAVVALGIVAVVAVIFLHGMTAISAASFLNDEHATAESLAQAQMESVKSATYVYDATTYSPEPVPTGKDFLGYAVSITAASLNTPDDGIQKISVRVTHNGTIVTMLEGYKVDR